ncbi:pyridoxal-phosphate dependent enzyme [Afifella sp. YEN Y35]|uniref:pyridoxal-phosphate dependent enzyme n=1 Tax=Afifella sp. YEN Y35 TaxID=3388337 RepID=UPI0039E061BA
MGVRGETSRQGDRGQRRIALHQKRQSGLQCSPRHVSCVFASSIAQSFEAGRPRPTSTARTFADGVACREPQAEALEIILNGAAGILQVGEDEVAEAIRILYTDTHNMAEGAGAAPLAALMGERERFRGQRVALILTEGNIDMPVLRQILSGKTPVD